MRLSEVLDTTAGATNDAKAHDLLVHEHGGCGLGGRDLGSGPEMLAGW